MKKVIIYHLDAPGLVHNYADNGRFLETEVPENWDKMTPEEQRAVPATVFMGVGTGCSRYAKLVVAFFGGSAPAAKPINRGKRT